MKKVICAMSALVVSAVVFADIPSLKSATEVRCETVRKAADGLPDLDKVNEKFKASKHSVDVKSVSVTQVGSSYLVCTTATDKK